MDIYVRSKAERDREKRRRCALRTSNSRALSIARLEYYNFDALEHE
jgi:hypothetical protein